MTSKLETITLGGGCFWCLEAVFQRLKGVHSVVSGYAGGSVKNPDYEAVCSGRTGHAEVVQIQFDPEIISTDDLLKIFFHIHNPTTLNRQGNDAGTQYRSVIFFSNAKQKDTALACMKEIESERVWKDSIVTEIAPLDIFYPAEEYHQNYYNDNSTRNPYCTYVIDPKLNHLTNDFRKFLL